MYSVNVKIVGVSPLMQHRYPVPDLEDLNKGGKRVSGSVDYTQEWKDYMYTAGGEVVQPSVHIESSMVKGAVNFKITGKRGKTYKDLFKAAVFVEPENISHHVPVPETLDADADKELYLDLRPVVINRARVVRIRPTFKAGWELEFVISVLDDQIPLEIVQDVLTLAGRTVGIGDFRPKFGRFRVARFEVIEEE